MRSKALRRLTFLALVWVLTLCGCMRLSSASSNRQPARPSVRHLDWSHAPEMAAHAERLRRIGNQVYPEIRLLLKDASRRAPRSFDIIFTNEPGGNVGQTIGSRIYLNAHYVSTPPAPHRVFKSPADLDAVLVHEMIHVVQQYDATAPACWAEGMADYVCSKLGYTNALNCLRCSAAYPHYLSGYQCAGAFLLFVETRYTSNVIPDLHRQLRRGSYTESFFPELSGKALNQLWSEFQQTPAFTPGAGEVPGSVANAMASLLALKNAGRLPGFSSNDRGSAMLSSTSFPGNSGTYPLALSLHVRKVTDSSLYDFTLAQSSEGQPWQLQSARRLSRDYRVIEELPLPTPPP